MTSIQCIFHKLLLAGTLSLALLGADYHSPAWAQFGPHGQPGSSKGGASRGGCPNTPKPLKALVPVGDREGGLTVEARPTIWVYVPYTLTPEQSIEFVVQDDQKTDLYRTKLPGTNVSSGIISMTIPTNQSLEIGKTYTWHFMVNCGKVSDRPAFVSGWIKRIALKPALNAKATRLSPLERSALYVNNSIWYDALTVLGEGLRAKPTDKPLTASWSKLLQLPSVKLDTFTAEPLTPCCTAPTN